MSEETKPKELPELIKELDSFIRDDLDANADTYELIKRVRAELFAKFNYVDVLVEENRKQLTELNEKTDRIVNLIDIVKEAQRSLDSQYLTINTLGKRTNDLVDSLRACSTLEAVQELLSSQTKYDIDESAFIQESDIKIEQCND